MAVNWGLGLPQVNPGEQFANAFKQGQETARQNKARAAMAALARDPNNTGALSALAEADPETAMQFRKQQLEYAKTQVAQHQESILKGAQIIRQVGVKDQATLDQARTVAAQAGLDISGVPTVWNDQTAQYVNGLVSLADAFKPEHDTQDPSMIREFDIATQRRLVPQGTTYQQFLTMRNPGMLSPVNVPPGATITPGTVDNLPTASTPEEASKLPPGTRFKMPDGRIGTVPGGAGGNASGGFL